MKIYEQILKRTAEERDRYRNRETYLTKDWFTTELTESERKTIPDRLATFFLVQLADNIRELVAEAESEEQSSYFLGLYDRFIRQVNGGLSSEITYGELPVEAQYFYIPEDDVLSEEEISALEKKLKEEWKWQ